MKSLLAAVAVLSAAALAVGPPALPVPLHARTQVTISIMGFSATFDDEFWLSADAGNARWDSKFSGLLSVAQAYQWSLVALGQQDKAYNHTVAPTTGCLSRDGSAAAVAQDPEAPDVLFSASWCDGAFAVCSFTLRHGEVAMFHRSVSPHDGPAACSLLQGHVAQYRGGEEPNLTYIFWKLLLDELFEYIETQWLRLAEAKRKGPCGPKINIPLTRVKDIIRMIVHCIGAGNSTATSFNEYLDMHNGRLGLDSNPVRRETWKQFVSKLKSMSTTRLADLFSAGFLRFWNLNGMLWLCLDESIVAFTGALMGKVFMVRKPTSEGGVVYVVCTLSASGKPIPLFIILVFEAGEKHLSLHDILELICNNIKLHQVMHVLSKPVCMVIDAAFGTVESLQRHNPDILFITSAPDSEFKELLGDHLPLNESHVCQWGAVLQAAFKDSKIVYNLSTFFVPAEPVPIPPCQEPVLSKQAIDLLFQFPDDDLRKLAQQCSMSHSGVKKEIIARIAHCDTSGLGPLMK
eukprot:m51a1_g1748 hypothetical protein (518) ;mRNA; r:199371-218020